MKIPSPAVPKKSFFSLDLEQAAKRNWDVVIIGAGVGGCTAAYSLSRQGLSVLLIEKGKSDLLRSPKVTIDTPDTNPDTRMNSGKWPTPITTVVNGVENDIWAPLGCGLGGSSRWYAAALTRLEPSDFDPEPHPLGHNLSWPISYSEIEPYYEEAEKLYSVSGSADPLSTQTPFNLKPPPAMCELDRHFFTSFQESGLHPYRIHLGVKNKNGCEGCGGRICPRACKQDAFESCLTRVATEDNLEILDRTEVLKLRCEKDQVSEVTVVRKKMETNISCKCVVLAAGAYFTPTILQNSQSQNWPNGLGNHYDLVGRNLMFHVSEFIAVWPKGNFESSGIRSTIAFRDYYSFEGEKFGELQSTGLAAGFGNILYFLHSVFSQSKLSKYSFLRHLLRIPAYIAGKLFKEATVFACAIEDFPYPENRLIFDTEKPAGFRVEYTIHSELAQRAKKFRTLLKSSVKKNWMYPLNIKPSPNFGHACGTCSAGDDPKKSVVDKFCRVHGVQNLFIVDASIMPKSGGANPSLTIAANSLRVAQRIVDSFNSNVH